MVNLGFCRTCFSAGKGRVDAARMHRGEALCVGCLKATGVEVIVPPVPMTIARPPLRRVVAKLPAPDLPRRSQDVDRELVKTIVVDRSGAVALTTVKMLPPIEKGLCSRGCGKATHRGLCRGQGSRNYAVAIGRLPVTAGAVRSGDLGEMVAEEMADSLSDDSSGAREELRMDKLVAEYVRAEDVPGKAEPVRKPTGRIGELWVMLEQAPPDRECVKVKCMDVKHAGYTSRHLRKKAEKAGREVVVQREGSDLYCWFVERAG